MDKWLVKIGKSDIIRILIGKKVLYMSDREKVYQLLDVVPDSKLPYVIGFIQGLLIVDIPEVINFCNDKKEE